MPVVNNNDNKAEFVTVPTLEQVEETFGDVLDSVINSNLYGTNYKDFRDFGFHRIDLIEALRISAGGDWSSVVHSDDNAIEILEDYAVTCTSAEKNFNVARDHRDLHFFQSDDEEEIEKIERIGSIVGTVHHKKAEKLIGYDYNNLTYTTVIFRKD